jgi:16S rRNA (cytidine1402-2'-O)-methyltransferase
VPGVSAVTTLVSVAGLPVDRFAFEGFLPARAAARTARLRGLAAESRAMVFLEAGRRLGAFLKDAEAALGDREAVIGRELTKVHEEQLRGRLSELRARVEAGEPVRGEVTIVVAGAAAPEEVAADVVDDAIREALASGESIRDVSAALAARFRLSRRELYRRALALRS